MKKERDRESIHVVGLLFARLDQMLRNRGVET